MLSVNFMDLTFLTRTEDQSEFSYYSGLESDLKSLIGDLHRTATNNIIKTRIIII